MADRKEREKDAAEFLANKGAPTGLDMPGDGSGPIDLVAPKPGADLEPMKAPEPPAGASASTGGEQRFVLRGGALVAEPLSEGGSNIKEPVEGGRYLVGGVLVNHAGEPVKE